MDVTDVDLFFRKKVQKDLLAYHAQITGKYGIVIFGSPSKVIKILIYGTAGSRSHASAHVQRIFKAEVCDFSGSDSCDHSAAIMESHSICAFWGL